LRDSCQNLDILLHDFFDTHSLYFQYNPRAIIKNGSVNLPDRGGGKWFEVDHLEMGFIILPEFCTQGFTNLTDFVRFDLETELFEFFTETRADQVGARCENLSQFDEGRAQVGECHAYPLFTRVLRQWHSASIFE